MKKCIVLLLVVCSLSQLKAQNKTTNSMTYKTGVGLKIWDGGGITLKTFISDKKALEFIGFFNGNGTRVTGLYEIHGDLSTEGNLKWYAGPGAHVGFYKVSNVTKTVIGVDGVIGLDYKFKELPLNLSLDWQPSFEIGKGYGFTGAFFGLSVRYTL
jgi:hypothetical protein